MPFRRDIRRALPVGAWFSALALVVAGPLLGSGYVLLLDYPSGPRFPALAPFPLPSSGDIGNGIPLLSVLALFREIHAFFPDKVLLLAPIIVGGLGVYRLARARLGAGWPAAVYGGTLFVVNPFVYDRYLSGHLFFLLAYSLLPWALAPILDMTRRPTVRTTVVVALWIFVLGAIDVHVLGIYVLLTCVAVILAPSRLRLAFGAAALGAGVLVCAYWILPSLFVDHGSDIGPADLAVYASRPTGIAGPGERVPGLYLLLAPILGLAVAGVAELLRPGPNRRFALAISISATLGLLLAAGTSFPPTADVFRWAFEHVPYMGVYREPQKFLALVVLAYAVFGAVGLDAVVRGLGGSGGRSAVAATAGLFAVAAVVGYGYTVLWGFADQAKPVRYPDSWAEAKAVMDDRGEGRLLVLPWQLYTVWSFSDDRIVANPAPSFFSHEVLAGDEAGFTSVGPQSPDPFSRYIDEVLRHRAEIHWLGHLVAPLGVRFVASLREADWERYRFLTRQQDLVPIYRGEGLVLFENRAWRGSIIGLDKGATIAEPSQLFGSPREREVVSRLFPTRPLVSGDAGGFATLGRRLADGPQVGAMAAPFVATADRCSDGWRLGSDESTCDLGAVAAFESAPRARTLVRPLAGVQMLGYVFSGLTLAAATFYLLTCSRFSRKGSNDDQAPKGSRAWTTIRALTRSR
jgi:hypothetical protein